MNFKQVVYPCLLLILVAAAAKTYIWYFKEKPFYHRLKQRKRLPLFELKNLHAFASSIVGNLINNVTSREFIFKLNFFNGDIIHLQINDLVYPRYVPEDVIIRKPVNLTDCVHLRHIDDEIVITYKDLLISIEAEFFELNVFRNDRLLLSINQGQVLFIEEKEPRVGVSADFLFHGGKNCYGLPQRAERLSLSQRNNPYRLFNVDRFGYSASNTQSLYGSVPLVYVVNESGALGLLWMNSSETFVDLSQDRDGICTEFFSESGGIDVFVLTGPSLQDCIKQNSFLTGTSPLPPLFSLGYHQCRFSYMSQEEVKEVSDNFDENNIPLDCIWLDIDYTDDKKYFTWNKQTYKDPKFLLEYLKNQNRHAVAIIDPHIKVDDEYFVYKECKNSNYFVKNRNKTDFQARCWPGLSCWIDFLNPKARSYYANLNHNFAITDNLNVWNDMNEPALFDTEENCMDKRAVHFGGWKHRDVHNLYGFYQTMATYEGLLKRNNIRPFILTRSHFIGGQRFAAIWTGDNTAQWEHLKISIPMCLTASLCGFSFCGADVGGFVHHPEEELLQRWYQAASWLPFFRGHSNRNVPRREPYLYPKEIKERIKKSIEQRYKHLPYWYTIFWHHTQTKQPIIKPLIYQYFHDKNLLELDNQFLVGEDILVRPVTEPSVDVVEVYLPGEDEIWYCTSTLKIYRGLGYVNLPVDLDYVPVFYRGGSVIPIKETVGKSSGGMKNFPITLYVFPNNQNIASGILYDDDGKTFDYSNDFYTHVELKYESGKITNNIINNKYSKETIISSVKIFGNPNIKTALLNEAKLEVNRGNPLEIFGFNIDVRQNFVINLIQ